MNKRIKRLSTIFLTIILVTINTILISAYTDGFTSINSKDGLSENTITCFLQDSSGFVWIGTKDGLNRYNGYEFKIYRHDENNGKSIIGNSIIDLVEDNKNNIWIATTNGLSKINTITGNIVNYNKEKDEGNLSFDIITDILFTSDNKLLVATIDGLNLYNEETNSFEQILKGSQLLSQIVYSIEEDIKGNLWIATHEGINVIGEKNRKIYSYPTAINKDTGKTTSGDIVFKIISDEKGYIWANTFRYGVYKINLNDYSVVKYSHKDGDSNSIPGNFVRDVMRDKNNQVWVATNNGLARYNEKEGTFCTYLKKNYDSKSLIQNEVHSLMEDKSGLIWIGTYSGISIFNPQTKIEHYENNPSDSNSISESIVTTVFEDKNKYIWVGTYSKGINIIDRESGKITSINSSSEDGNSIVSDYINYITGYENEIYIATDYGLNIINTETKKVSLYTEENGLINNSIKSLYVDKSGNLWMLSLRGVTILTSDKKEFVDITPYIKESKEFNLYCNSIYEDKEGDIWLGFGLNGGLSKIEKSKGNNKIIDYKHKSSKNSIISDSVKSIAEDNLGNLWIGTDGGLSKLDKKTNKFTNYSKKDGLPSDVINGVLIDDNNNPWIISNSGVSKLDIESNSFENFNSTDGLQGNEYCVNSYYKSTKGELLFGGTNGLDIFYPEDIEKSNYNPDIVFDEFKIKGKTIHELDKKKLSYYENEINIKFFLPDYRNSSSTTYYYKLNNLREANDRKSWLTCKSNEINYSGIAPGKYEFIIKAMNHNGQMSNEKRITFTIKPPIWKSNLAIIIYIILLIIIIYMTVNKVKYLDNLVEQKTKDLVKEMDTNNELLTKVIALEKNKNNYFVNLSHELRTPLNVIYTSEQLITSLNNNKNGIDKEKLNIYMEVIRKNTKRLLNLINNLIDGSKIENGNYKIDLEDNDIVYVVEEAALSLKDYVESKGIQLIIDPEIEEKIIKCDANEIERCIVNLVSNACKFTPEGGKIFIKIKDLDDKTEINVIDTGIGIDKKYHDIIFNRFNQVVEVNCETKGSGLGLTITKQIIQLHGGEIMLESEVGKGSKFTIIL